MPSRAWNVHLQKVLEGGVHRIEIVFEERRGLRIVGFFKSRVGPVLKLIVGKELARSECRCANRRGRNRQPSQRDENSNDSHGVPPVERLRWPGSLLSRSAGVQCSTKRAVFVGMNKPLQVGAAALDGLRE